jgi:hypothetical protein
MSMDRRQTLRVPESRLITEIVVERPSPASIVNLSATGLYTVKPISSGLYGPRLVQLEIPVPEASESIWAAGDIVFESVGNGGVGTGIRFREMARFHHGLLQDIVELRRQEILAAMLQQIKWRKELAAHPSPFVAPPPILHEDTVKMYLIEV